MTFNHPDCIFEPEPDGLRTLAYVEAGACRLVSRNGNTFKTFDPVAEPLGKSLRAEPFYDGNPELRSRSQGRPAPADLFVE